MSERRSAPRLQDENILVLYLLSAENPARRRRGIHVLGIDISLTGVRCRIAEFLPIDTRLRMDIRLGEKERQLSAVGNVRWERKLHNCDLHEIGIAFDDLSSDFSNALQQYISARMPDA